MMTILSNNIEHFSSFTMTPYSLKLLTQSGVINEILLETLIVYLIFAVYFHLFLDKFLPNAPSLDPFSRDASHFTESTKVIFEYTITVNKPIRITGIF